MKVAEQTSYHVAWIAPNRSFPERICESIQGLDSLEKAQRVAQQLNLETRGASGHYVARRSTRINSIS